MKKQKDGVGLDMADNKIGTLIDPKKKEKILKRIHEGKCPLFMEKKPEPEAPIAGTPKKDVRIEVPVAITKETPLEVQLGEKRLTAIDNGYDDEAAKLLKEGANPNYENFIFVTPLMRAAESGHCGIIHLLLTSGAEINKADIDGRTALMHAAFNGQTEAAKQLVKNNANVEAKDKNDKTAGMHALENNFPALARILGTDPGLDLGLGED